MGSDAVPVKVTIARTAETVIAAACVVITSRRVSNRSTMTPANRPRTVNGRKRQKARMPIASGEPESWITSHASAMFCIHDPASETSCPAKKSL